MIFDLWKLYFELVHLSWKCVILCHPTYWWASRIIDYSRLFTWITWHFFVKYRSFNNVFYHETPVATSSNPYWSPSPPKPKPYNLLFLLFSLDLLFTCPNHFYRFCVIFSSIGASLLIYNHSVFLFLVQTSIFTFSFMLFQQFFLAVPLRLNITHYNKVLLSV